MQRKSLAFEISLNALLIAMVFVSTMFIQIRLPFSVNGGLIHFGTVALVIAAIVFGKKRGAIAGAFGMALFDVLSGWVIWAPGTFIIRGVMGYMIGLIAERGNGKSWGWNLTAVLAGGAWMIAGYYLYEVLLYGNWVTPMSSVPGNISQILLAIVIGLPLVQILKRNPRLDKMFK